MTRPQLIAKMERDQAAVERAAASLADLVRLQAEIAQMKRDLAVANSKAALVVVKQVPGPVRTVIKEVATPCPKQAEEIKALQHRLSEFADCDMDKFKQWRKMVDVAKGKK